jgi:hypothetical protein
MRGTSAWPSHACHSAGAGTDHFLQPDGKIPQIRSRHARVIGLHLHSHEYARGCGMRTRLHGADCSAVTR